ncbi:MAG: helix-turn-helix transcriptional regulator [Chloroflexota bacterium]
MESFRRSFNKVSKFLNIQLEPINESPPPDTDEAVERFEPTAFVLPPWAENYLFGLAARLRTSPQKLFIRALSIGIRQMQADQETIQEWHQLTPKQREVAAWVCLGLSNEEIAEELSIAINTVKAHVYHIFRNFSVENRRELQIKLSWWNAERWLFGD